MLRLLPPFHKRVKTTQAPARRPRRFRPFCEPLEDRCLLTGPTIDLSGPSDGLVGAPVTWTASTTDEGSTPVCQFSVTPSGGTTQMVQDFSTSSSFTWNPMQEGNYDIDVTIKSSYNATSGETTSTAYTADSRINGTSAVVSPTANPLVALYSAPPTSGTSMYVQFSPDVADPSWQDTAAQPIVPGESSNFLVAGLLPDTTYLLRDVVENGTPSAPLTFTTGSLPTDLNFPTFSVQQPPSAATDPTQNMIFHITPGATPGTVESLATDLSGNINWYYDPQVNNFAGYATTLLPGGSMLMLGGNQNNLGGVDTLKEADLLGDALHKTNIYAVNAQLAAMGYGPIIDFNHDAQLLPNGDTAVIANTQRTINVGGTPTVYTGNDVIVLDKNFQVAWVWDAFDWLDTGRLGTDGEGPNDWLHSNSISWSPEDGNLIVSMRAQDWVIKIDYNNGAGDGHIIWRLGQGGDFTVNSTDPSPWFSHQHDVRYINDNMLLVFDDGNTRRMTNGSGDSRGQEWVLNEQTMTATLVVNADLGNYSFALGSAQMLPNGNLDFNSGLISSDSGFVGQSIEVSPDGSVNYVLQQNAAEYRSYFMSNLYGGANFSYGQLDGGFEDPGQGTAASAYQYDPTDSAWNFSGTSGMAGNGSAITSNNPDAPEGSQVAFVQGSGTIGQVVNVTANGTTYPAGTYKLSFDAAQGGTNSVGNNEEVEVEVDGTVVATFTPSSSNYATYTTPTFNLTAGSHTITFVGVDPSGSGDTALLDGVNLAVVPVPGTGKFLGMDTSTEGSWQNVYGSQGYNIIDNAVNYPSFANVSVSGNLNCTWASSTTDPRALLDASGTGSMAACWYNPTSFTVNVNITDGQTHQLALYLLDWDSLGRTEEVDILNASTGAVLSTQTLSNFQNGEYLVYNVSGDVTIRIANEGGLNAVLSGLFLDTAGTLSPSITTQPSNQTVSVGQTATFTASASGNPTPTAQWQVSSDGGKTFTNISGATSTTLTLSNVTSAMSGNEYQAVFTNSAGTATTTAATLIVQIAPAFLSGNSAVFTVGQSGKVIVSATGSPLPSLMELGSLPSGVTFRDNGNGTAILGGTPAAGTMGTYYFTVRAHNGVGSDATQSFTLTVNSVSAPPSPPPSPPSPPALKVPPLLAFLDRLLEGVETVNTNGTETITDFLFGIPLLVSTFDSSGNLVSVTLFGFDITFLFV